MVVRCGGWNRLKPSCGNVFCNEKRYIFRQELEFFQKVLGGEWTCFEVIRMVFPLKKDINYKNGFQIKFFFVCKPVSDHKWYFNDHQLISVITNIPPGKWMAQLPLVLVYHGPLLVATFLEGRSPSTFTMVFFCASFFGEKIRCHKNSSPRWSQTSKETFRNIKVCELWLGGDDLTFIESPGTGQVNDGAESPEGRGYIVCWYLGNQPTNRIPVKCPRMSTRLFPIKVSLSKALPGKVYIYILYIYIIYIYMVTPPRADSSSWGGGSSY